MRRYGLIALGAVLIVVVAALIVMRPDRLLRIAAGATSANVCSEAFVSGFDPDRSYNEVIRPLGGMGLIAWALNYDVDRDAKTVRTTVLGGFESVSEYHPGYGCRIKHDGDVALPLGPENTDDLPANDIAGPEIVAPTTPALAKAIDQAFAATDGDSNKQIGRAVIVVHNGKIVAERYADGIGMGTPLISRSVAKSITSALIGILVRDGKLSLEQTVSSPAWEAPVNVDQMLRMTTGLPLDEGMGPGLAQQMWFAERDQAAFASSIAQVAKPGETLAYGNLGYAELSRLIRFSVGGTPEAVVEFARKELFLPLGMSRTFMEFDGAGSPMGSNSFFGAARDYARFGQLYLNDGVVNGKRILPEGWVEHSRRQTLDTGYGAGFWLNVTDGPIKPWPGAHWGMKGAPKDTYYARGFAGQFVVIVPSENLVVVRLGITQPPDGGMRGIGDLVRDVIVALHAAP